MAWVDEPKEIVIGEGNEPKPQPPDSAVQSQGIRKARGEGSIITSVSLSYPLWEWMKTNKLSAGNILKTALLDLRSRREMGKDSIEELERKMLRLTLLVSELTRKVTQLEKLVEWYKAKYGEVRDVAPS